MQTLVTIAIDSLAADPAQPRKRFNPDALLELAESIRANGLIQPPTVRPSGDTFIIVAGERRWRACKMLGWTSITVLVEDVALDRVRTIQVVENMVRADMTPMEEANALFAMVEKAGIAETAKTIGKSTRFVERRLRLLKLIDPRFAVLIDGGGLPPSNAELIADLPADAQTAVLSAILKHEGPMNEDEVRSLVRAAEAEIAQRAQLGFGFTVQTANPKAQRARKRLDQVLEGLGSQIRKLLDPDTLEVLPSAGITDRDVEVVRGLLRDLGKLERAMTDGNYRRTIAAEMKPARRRRKTA